MTWIKTEDLLPPTHEVILFQDNNKNEHYGVLCGDMAEPKKRNKFWCHIFQKSYNRKEVIYWTAIPLNKDYILNHIDFTAKVNEFLWETVHKIEKEILEDFEEHQKENPTWKAEQFVGIAVRNTCWRIMNLLKVIKK